MNFVKAEQALKQNTILNDLKNQFFYRVPFSVPQDEVLKAVEAFFKFLALPEPIKQVVNFSIAPMHRRGDIGYRKRDPDIDDRLYNDRKEFFHFHPAILDKYPRYIGGNPVVKDFFEQALPIWESTYHIVERLLNNLDEHNEGVAGKVYDTKCPHIALRFLRYDWQQSNELLAKPHYDSGAFTLAIAESEPGLRIGSEPSDLKLVSHTPEEALFMLSSNFDKVLTTRSLKPAWHDVFQLDKSKIGKPYARWAVVAFIEAHGVEAKPRAETHKWDVCSNK